MQGLIKNNYYKIRESVKLLLLFIIILGIPVVVFDNENTSLLTGFAYLSMVGFPLSTAMSLCRNNSGKWNQYILTFPIRRRDVIKSIFLSQASALVIGIVLAGIVFTASFAIHGFPFYRYVDVFSLFSSAITISFFMSAMFFFSCHIDSKNRTEIIGIISLLFGIGIVMGIISVLNIYFEEPTNTGWFLFCVGVCMQLSAFSIYVMSYFLTSYVYEKKEF